MDKRDIKFLNKTMSELDGRQADASNSTVLFWSWYKVPDNVPTIFTGKGLPPLIRTERFQPPYRMEVREE